MHTTGDDPWQRYPCPVPLHVYGAGSRRHFAWYLDGTTATPPMDPDTMKDWLTECRYERDDVLFNERDVWQHPITFEQLRRGDCEDFSLWTWRKLHESGYRAEFVAGWTVLPDEVYQGHAWVQFKDRGETWLFDPVVRDPGRMVRPLGEVAGDYVPQVSVDCSLDQFVYGGYYRTLKRDWAASLRSPEGIEPF